MANSYSMELCKKTQGWLNELGFDHQFYEDTGVFKLESGIDCSIQRYILLFKIRANGITSRSIIPIKVIEPKRPSVAEFFTRINYGLIEGNFEMDFADGEVAFRMYMHKPNTLPTDDDLCRTVAIHDLMWSEYSNAFLKVVFTDIDPHTTITQIED